MTLRNAVALPLLLALAVFLSEWPLAAQTPVIDVVGWFE